MELQIPVVVVDFPVVVLPADRESFHVVLAIRVDVFASRMGSGLYYLILDNSAYRRLVQSGNHGSADR